jgi:hypothetical protein
MGRVLSEMPKGNLRGETWQSYAWQNGYDAVGFTARGHQSHLVFPW